MVAIESITLDNSPPEATSDKGYMFSPLFAQNINSILSKPYRVTSCFWTEIDTGTSGQTSQKIGKKLKEVSVQKQVILVSHQAQIASNANTHISIYKESISNRNITKAKVLNTEEHIREIAKIISGEKITEHALKHAKEMTRQ